MTPATRPPYLGNNRLNFPAQIHPNALAGIATPSHQTTGAGLKRQEPSGARTVSESKRVKREAAEQYETENNRKVGDRNLQTTEPRYGPFSGAFNNPDEARNRLTTVQWTPPQDANVPTPSSPQQMLAYVIQVYDAMVDTQAGFYDKVNVANRILNRKYESDHIEAVAWLIVVSFRSL